jgi:hypothetical protein
MTIPTVYWTAHAVSNRKTGDIPTAYVGATREESLASCKGCPLLANRNCYAQFGTVNMAHRSILRSVAKGREALYTFDASMARRAPTAKAIRLAAIGEPGRMPLYWWKRVDRSARVLGLDVIAYIHNWRQRKDLVGLTMASCDSLEQVDEAKALGFRATVVLPRSHTERTFTTPAGHRGIVCPAQLAGKMTPSAKGAGTKGRPATTGTEDTSKSAGGRKPITCNDCRLCDGSKAGPVIGFIDHGPIGRVSTRKPTPWASIYKALTAGPVETRALHAQVGGDAVVSMRMLRVALTRLERDGIAHRVPPLRWALAPFRLT